MLFLLVRYWRLVFVAKTTFCFSRYLSVSFGQVNVERHEQLQIQSVFSPQHKQFWFFIVKSHTLHKINNFWSHGTIFILIQHAFSNALAERLPASNSSQRVKIRCCKFFVHLRCSRCALCSESSLVVTARSCDSWCSKSISLYIGSWPLTALRLSRAYAIPRSHCCCGWTSGTQTTRTAATWCW